MYFQNIIDYLDFIFSTITIFLAFIFPSSSILLLSNVFQCLYEENTNRHNLYANYIFRAILFHPSSAIINEILNIYLLIRYNLIRFIVTCYYTLKIIYIYL